MQKRLFLFKKTILLVPVVISVFLGKAAGQGTYFIYRYNATLATRAPLINPDIHPPGDNAGARADNGSDSGVPVGRLRCAGGSLAAAALGARHLDAGLRVSQIPRR